MGYLMKPFHDLTRTAQFRRLASLARHALRDYDLGDVSLSPLQYIQNATWSVQCRSGQRYALRVHAPRRHDTAAIRSELLWLEVLSADGFIVPAPVRTVRRDLWTTASAEGVPEARVCTLLTWVPGRAKEAVDQARVEAGLSLADMAERTGMDKAALSRLESGKQPNPTLQ